MGIPIDGKFNKFKKSLEKKGLKYIMPLNNHYIFKGRFAGDESYIYVMCDNKAKTVCGVGVSIECMSQENGKYKFENYVRDYEDKYETDKWKKLYRYYIENRDSLSEHIINGNFKYYNDTYTFVLIIVILYIFYSLRTIIGDFIRIKVILLH